MRPCKGAVTRWRRRGRRWTTWRSSSAKPERGLADVVKATVFVTDRAFLAGVSAVVLDRLEGHVPAFSALIVKGLASPELLMEVDITAVIADDRP